MVIWRRSVELVAECYRLSAKFPPGERYGMTAQLRRAACSIAANIAEGNGRDSAREFLHFLSIARGSLREVQTYLALCRELGYATATGLERAIALADEIGRMLHGLRHRHLPRAKAGKTVYQD